MLKKAIIFFVIIISLGLLSVFYPYFTGEKEINPVEYEREQVFVTRVIDGDTLVYEINNISYTCRLLGINTPEKKMFYYQKAKDFLKQVENKTIQILRDKEDEDKYDRKLRYVFYKNNLLNAEILQEGLATSFMLKGLKYEDKFRNAENYAKNKEIRLWEKSEDKCAKCILLVELNYSVEYFIIKNKCNFDCELKGWIVKDNANHFFKLNNLFVGEEEKYQSKGSVWNNNGDRFFMRDEIGGLVVFYEY
jgi:endonuclease YncB( thermonuclease family)